METRASVDAIIDRIYEARERNNPGAAAECFSADASFMANGAPSASTEKAARLATLTQLFEAFEVLELRLNCRVIDPPRAAVSWRGKFRAKNGNVGEAEILDVMEVKDGKIASLTTFFDTAYAAQLSGQGGR